MSWVPAGTLQYFTDDAGRQHHADWLFVETLRDLRERCALPLVSAERYWLLGIAPLLRKLLADGSKTLVEVVARPAGRPQPTSYAEEFRVVPTYGAGKLMGLGIQPKFPTGDGLGGRDLGQFLTMRAGRVLDEDVRVVDVIRHYSHVEGGVHFGVPTNPASKILQMSVVDPPDSFPLLVGALSSIGSTVLNACVALDVYAQRDIHRRRTAPRPDETESPNARLGFPPPEVP